MSTEPAPPGPRPDRTWLNADRIFFSLLVVSLPLAIAAHYAEWAGPVTFILCAVALIPLARLMGTATEVIAHHAGPGLGGLLNASFGNAAELIIGIAALRQGHVAVVKASITGAVLGNLLLVLGAAVLVGGARREKQTFNATAALSGAAMMFLAVTAMAVPDVFHLVRGEAGVAQLPSLSIAISVVLLVLYVLSLLFALRTHAHLYAGEGLGTQEEIPPWSVGRAVGVLLASTAGVVVVAEFLVHSLEEAIQAFGFTETFVGVVIVAIIGNAAEHSTAVLMALKNKMDLAFNIAFESSKQIALFVAPVLVLLAVPLGQTLTLEFTHIEVFGIAVGVGGASLIALDGKSNWLEGAMLIGLYAVLSVAFFFVP
jgi:Ca2+:H+ antiporter